jgi:hypothetical protein
MTYAKLYYLGGLALLVAGIIKADMPAYALAIGAIVWMVLARLSDGGGK